MAKVKNAYYSGYKHSAATIENFFNTVTTSIFTLSRTGNVLDILVDNTVTVQFDYGGYKTKTIYNGSTVEYSMINNANAAEITVAASDTMLYIQYNCIYGQGRRFAFLYEKIGEGKYWGAVGPGTSSGAGHAWYSITEIPVTDTVSGISYSHAARLSFSEQVGYISFSTDALFNGGVKKINDPNFITCSSVTANRVITFHLNNFYSVGANTLVLMDPEPEA